VPYTYRHGKKLHIVYDVSEKPLPYTNASYGSDVQKLYIRNGKYAAFSCTQPAFREFWLQGYNSNYFGPNPHWCGHG
jgi:hypothetical protein